ncbi:MAG: protein disulfide oxidoreductase [Burkholderiales bacterium]
MVNSKKWLRRFAEILIFAALLAGIRSWQQRDVPEGPAPILAGRLLDGKVFEKGRGPILVHFWAIWCPICRTEQTSIEALSKSHRVITVALKSGKGREVAQYMKREGLDFPVLNDPDGLISDAWGVHAVPASFVLDGDGKIRFVEFGYTTGIGLRVRLWLASF